MINCNQSSLISSFETLSCSSNEDNHKYKDNDSFLSISWSPTSEDFPDNSPSSEKNINVSNSTISDSKETFLTDKEKWANEIYKTGAVVPFYWNAFERQGYYLMGEDVVKDEKAVKLNDWSFFGGYREENETSPVDTAIRECTEESIGLLENLKDALLNKRAVEFKSFKNYIYIVDLFPENNEHRRYSLEQINDFHTNFNKLNKTDLNEVQKEKRQLGWIKASEIAQKVFSRNAQYSVYEQPCNTSAKLGDNLMLRECQKWFFIDAFKEFQNGAERIKLGWSGLEGRTIILNRNNNKSFEKDHDRVPSQPLPAKRYSQVQYKQAPHPLDAKTSWRSTNISNNNLNDKKTLDVKSGSNSFTNYHKIKPSNSFFNQKKH